MAINPAPSYRYPQSPKNVDQKLIEPSRAFRKEVIRVLKSILVFILTYIILVFAAVALATLCALAGLWIVTAIPNFWTIIFGIGFVGVGIMVLYFLLKFIFKRNTVDLSKMIRLTRREQPVLFEFIEELAGETKTPLPKRVYVSPSVDAFVFYDSSFWSMFFPVRKNLNVGIGLVNCLNVSEFKAVIAHEFGHFSQRSMKLSSYVYHVNHVLFNLLYDNEDYEQTLESWGNFSGVFAFFATFTLTIVKSIQKILEYLYRGINQRYLALSRQMEFHADAVAASVSGSSAPINALYKIDMAEICYRTVLEYYDSWIAQNRKGRNAYEDHRTVMKNFADAHFIPVDENNIMKVSSGILKKYNNSRVIISNQWASHPDIGEREKQLLELNIKSHTVEDSAWALFKNPEQLQHQLTDNIYTHVLFEQQPEIVDNETFRSLFFARVEKYSLNKAYKGFYDDRNITSFDPDLISQQETRTQNLDDVLTENVLTLPLRVNGLKTDIQILASLSPEAVTTQTFDFDGKKYHREESGAVMAKLQEELEQLNAELDEADKEMFRLCFKKAATVSKEKRTLDMYIEMFSVRDKTDSEIKHLNSMIREADKLFQPNIIESMATALTDYMKREGTEIKTRIRKMLAEANLAYFYSEDEMKKLQMFVDDKRKYFFNVGFDSEAVNLYLEAINIYSRIILENSFHQKKKTLDMQIKVIQGAFEYAEW